MELRQLRYFVAVAEELHFRRAAERLYVAQPAISEQIRKLEVELGVRLFNRTNRRVELSDAGAAMLDEARRALAQVDSARLAACNAGERAVARLRIAYPPGSLPVAVPRALAHLSRTSPGLQVSVEMGPVMRLVQRLRDRQLDAVVTALPAATSGLVVTSLGRQRTVAVVPESHPRQLATAVLLAQLSPGRLVVLPRDVNPAFHDTVLSLARGAGLAPSLHEVTEQRVEAVLLAVAAGAGVAVLPAAVTQTHSIPGVRFIPLADDEAVFESALLSHPHASDLPTAALLSSVVRFSSAATARAPEPGEGRPAVPLAA
jgi:DNA-binding transcriptional LysR family regulator